MIRVVEIDDIQFELEPMDIIVRCTFCDGLIQTDKDFLDAPVECPDCTKNVWIEDCEEVELEE